MATLKEIRGRIRAAKNIQQITKAMKLVAAARLKKATDRVLQARPYSERMRGLMESLSAAGELPPHPLMEKRPTRRVLIIVVASERGLAGGYNTAIMRKAADFVRDVGHPASLVTVGKKATQFFTKRGYDVVDNLTLPSSGARLEDAVDLARRVQAKFESGEVDAIYVCYSKFYSAIRQVPQVVQLLPIEPPVTVDQAAAKTVEYKFEPGPGHLLETLLPRYFLTLVQQALFEATASEFGARMTAMTSATDNAAKMINTLTLKANRERQSAITTEILEVVGGAEALKN